MLAGSSLQTLRPACTHPHAAHFSTALYRSPSLGDSAYGLTVSDLSTDVTELPQPRLPTTDPDSSSDSEDEGIDVGPSTTRADTGATRPRRSDRARRHLAIDGVSPAIFPSRTRSSAVAQGEHDERELLSVGAVSLLLFGLP